MKKKKWVLKKGDIYGDADYPDFYSLDDLVIYKPMLGQDLEDLGEDVDEVNLEKYFIAYGIADSLKIKWFRTKENANEFINRLKTKLAEN